MINSLRQNEISELAEFIANKYCPLDFIDPEIIAKHSQISFNYGNYQDYFDGLLEYENQNFHIYINLDRVKQVESERARFTFAHELGHYFIDSHRNSLISGRSPSHGSFVDFKSYKNPAEYEADFFAASLLMPTSRLQKNCNRKKFTFSLIEDLCMNYKTSLTSTLIKFSSIGNHPICIVFTQDNNILWFQQSADFPFKYIKNIKSKRVPVCTVASEYFENKTKYISEEIVYAEDWFDYVGKYDLRRVFFEKCIYSEAYNFIISVIWEN